MIGSPRMEIIGMQPDEREALLARAAEAGIAAQDLERMRAVFESYEYVTELIEQKNQTLGRLRKMIFGSRTESRANVLERTPSRAVSTPPAPEEPAASPKADAPSAPAPATKPAPKPGHGRRAAEDYPGATHVPLKVPGLRPGDECPACHAGTLYERTRPGVLIRFTGHAPVQATIYELQKLRCQACGQLSTATPPAEVTDAPKYDPTVAAAIGVLKYGAGVPFHRVERLQDYAGAPLAASTQWMLIASAVDSYCPPYEELIRGAAQGELLHNDDTTARILEYMGRRREQASTAAADAGEETEADSPVDERRTGLFTTNVLAELNGRRIALYFTGRRHAGENLNEVLRRRAADLPPPLQMCDALSRNYPTEFQTIVGNCLTHGRRRFVDLRDRFFPECERVLNDLAVVYRADAEARERGDSPEERLRHHQAISGPVLQRLREWLDESVQERRVEPNSGLGAAIDYLRRHWTQLTLFLRQAGAPLDNNVCERALKKAILHRKNALFYKTQRGADVGDIHMTLIHTCELCDANPFEYLTELQRHAEAVAAAPAEWLPWNYRDALAALAWSERSPGATGAQ